MIPIKCLNIGFTKYGIIETKNHYHVNAFELSFIGRFSKYIIQEINIMSLSLNPYTLSICPKWGNCSLQESNYVVMPGNDCKYSIKLQNHAGTSCDATITLDNDNVGTFRICPYSTIEIERPSYNNKQFTYYKGGSSKSYKAGYEKGNSTNGLVKVVFRPAKKPAFVDFFQLESTSLCNSAEPPLSFHKKRRRRSNNLSEGITGLSGHSDQSFHELALLDYDDDNIVTIMVRLVSKDQSSNEPDIVPLGKKSTEYPKPVSVPGWDLPIWV